ncbi:ORF11 [Ovine gammaherpesvirus 2]|uniref:ORF11 n=1 Tax=Ovine gammaherpesvirus 2 TaxID=10398 RepID=Q2VSM5_9GAMA|nr:ORF11 [Ovine gammaherpesvirus 2]AAX58051.1 ORF11 [Ovine gammaherpesvirus 2]
MATEPETTPKQFWGLRSFRRFRTTTQQLPHWTFSIFDTYIRFTNCHKINVTSSEAYLPTCPSLAVILKNTIPDYSFHSSAWNCKTQWLRYMLFGDEDNPLSTRVSFIDSSATQIRIKLQHAAYQMAPAHSLIFYLVPITTLCLDHLYLRCRPDRQPCIMGSSCCQEVTRMDTSTPVLRMRGLMYSWEQEEFPFLLGLKTKDLDSKFVRVRTVEGEVCKVNDVCMGSNYIKVHVDYHYSLDRRTIVDVCLSPTSSAVISFKYSPFVKSPWVPNAASVPIVYMGPPIIIPSLCSTVIEYCNKYYVTKGLNVTAMLLGLEGDDIEFEAEASVWAPTCTAQISVFNKSAFTRTLTEGTHLANAIFVVAEKQLLANVLTQSQLRCLTTCLKLPGGFCANAAKLPRISLTNAKKKC